MFSARLFLGFPVTPPFADQLNEVSPKFLQLFIQRGDEYLQDIIKHEMRYLGKFINEITDLPRIELLEANIYSLLKKILPDYPCQETPLVLFSTVSSTAE